MSEDKALVPVDERTVNFYGDELTAVLVDVDGQEVVYVPLRPICDYLGVAWPAQRLRINRDPVLSEVAMSVIVTITDIEPGSKRPHTSNMLCLPLEFLNGFLFGINASRVKPEIKEGLVRYQRECYRILASAFIDRGQAAVSPAVANLVQIREMGLAIAKLAEEQIEHERRLSTVEQRLERAAVLVGSINKRLGSIERRVAPGKPISDEQAAELKELVKAVAMDRGGDPGQFQAIWGELHRRFGVSSYKLIPQARFAAVLAFLEEWRQGLGK